MDSGYNSSPQEADYAELFSPQRRDWIKMPENGMGILIDDVRREHKTQKAQGDWAPSLRSALTGETGDPMIVCPSNGS